jgi:hypothetical protein
MPAFDTSADLPPPTAPGQTIGDPFLDWYHSTTAIAAPPVAPPPLPPVDGSLAGAPSMDPFTIAPASSDAPPPVAPSVQLGPQLPTATDGLDGSMFDPSAQQLAPQGAPLQDPGAPQVDPFGGTMFDPGAGPQPVGPGPALPMPPGTDAAAPPVVLGPQLPPAPPQGPQIDVTAGDPFAGMTDAQGYAAAQQLATRDPAAFAELQANELKRKQLAESTARLKAEDDNLAAIKADQAAKAKADAATQAKMDQITADAIALSKKPLDRGRWFRNLSTFGKVASVLAGIVGGLYQGRNGGPNQGLDMVTKHIDDDINDQKFDIENGRAGLVIRQGAVAQEFARTGNLFQAAETVRIAAYQATINKLQTDQQNFDPRGTAFSNYGRAIQGMQGQAAQAHEAMRKTIFEENFKTNSQIQVDTAQTETRRHNRAEESLSWAREAREKASAKAAEHPDLANQVYNVPTGWNNPFDKTQPILGKRTIGGKGEDAKEKKTVGDQIDTYVHVQDYWAKLAAVGAKIAYHKSAPESVWSKWKDTDAAEYDSAKEALVVYLTKELGDKLTQGQLEAQAHRIPDRANVLESRDPGKQIRDAQEDADRDFSRNMDLVGINPDPIIKGAQVRRAVATPSADQSLDAAHAAVAADPQSKDAKAALEDAEQRARAAVALEQQHRTAISDASKLPPAPPPLHDEPDRPVPETTAVREANRALHAYDLLSQKLAAERDSSDHLRGLTQPGDVAAANRVHQAKLGELATETLQAHQLAEQLAAKAQTEVGRNTINERAAVARRLIAGGVTDPAAITEMIDNQQAPASPPAAWLEPDPDLPYSHYADPFTAHPDAPVAPPPAPVKPKTKAKR